jgi:Pentapeptide repeats (8 copies)
MLVSYRSPRPPGACPTARAMPARSSRPGGSTTTTAGPIRRSATPRPKNLPHLTADLSQTDIQHIDFARSDLRGARFDSASLHYTNFDGADLRGASFLGADLLGTKFGDANLQDTNFEGAQNCLYHQFAGAKLSRAKLPENIATFSFLDHVDETSKNARSIFLAMVIACIYSWLTITTKSDAALLSNRVSSPLPIIQTI